MHEHSTMHYHLEVWIPKDTNIKNLEEVVGLVAKYMKPLSEKMFWDSWQIGGRFSGSHDDYNPNTDPKNLGDCYVCLGTRIGYGDLCRICNGTGLGFKWSTDWAHHEGDIMKISELKNLKPNFESCILLVDPHEPFFSSKFYSDKGWNGDVFTTLDELKIAGRAVPGRPKADLPKRKALEPQSVTEGYLVTVDLKWVKKRRKKRRVTVLNSFYRS